MDQPSVFYEEWLRSLREQYKQVARKDDRVTLSSLTAVMSQVGFREDELRQLQIEATMRAQDVGEDYRADLNILDRSNTAHPAECLCPECVTIDESQFDAEGQPLAPDTESDDRETSPVFPVADIAVTDLAEETEPVTFEDSVAVDALPPDEAESEPADDENGGESAPDAPEQMSLF